MEQKSWTRSPPRGHLPRLISQVETEPRRHDRTTPIVRKCVERVPSGLASSGMALRCGTSPRWQHKPKTSSAHHWLGVSNSLLQQQCLPVSTFSAHRMWYLHHRTSLNNSPLSTKDNSAEAKSSRTCDRANVPPGVRLGTDHLIFWAKIAQLAIRPVQPTRPQPTTSDTRL